MSVTPVHGVQPYSSEADTRPIHHGPRRRAVTDWAKWLTLGMAMVAMLVALVVWAQSNLDGKAPAASLMDVQLRLARVETDLAWIKGTLASIARQTGAVSPP